MSGYTPVFQSVFTGTLCGKYPDTAAWLFLLALADKNGNVDMTPQYISSVTGMPVADLIGCINRFMEPDPHSRSVAEEGRRLVAMTQERAWGWHIVNHTFYREKARLQAKDARRTEAGVDAERKREERASPAVPRCPPSSPSQTQTQTQTQAKATHTARAREENGNSFANPIHDWRKTPGIDRQAFGDWLGYLDQAQKRVSPATAVSMSKALAATGNAEHQRELIAYHIQSGWKNIRNIDLEAEKAVKPTPGKLTWRPPADWDEQEEVANAG